MLVLELEGVEIDYCPLTNGIWLDAGELDVLFEDRKAAEEFISSFSIDERSREKKLHFPGYTIVVTLCSLKVLRKH